MISNTITVLIVLIFMPVGILIHQGICDHTIREDQKLMDKELPETVYSRPVNALLDVQEVKSERNEIPVERNGAPSALGEKPQQTDEAEIRNQHQLIEGKSFKIPEIGTEFIWIKKIKGWVGKYEITNREYRKFKPHHVSKKYESTNEEFRKFKSSYIDKGFEDIAFNKDEQPAIFVSYNDALEFAEWLANLGYSKGWLPKKDWKFRLPSKNEWFILAQCGDSRKFPWGDKWPPEYGHYLIENGPSKEKNKITLRSVPVTCSVKESGRNDWGLFGTGGNVMEWTTELIRSNHVVRGASWQDFEPEMLGCSYRESYPGKSRLAHVGFRLLLIPTQKVGVLEPEKLILNPDQLTEVKKEKPISIASIAKPYETNERVESFAKVEVLSKSEKDRSNVNSLSIQNPEDQKKKSKIKIGHTEKNQTNEIPESFAKVEAPAKSEETQSNNPSKIKKKVLHSEEAIPKEEFDQLSLIKITEKCGWRAFGFGILDSGGNTNCSEIFLAIDWGKSTWGIGCLFMLDDSLGSDRSPSEICLEVKSTQGILSSVYAGLSTDDDANLVVEMSQAITLSTEWQQIRFSVSEMIKDKPTKSSRIFTENDYSKIQQIKILFKKPEEFKSGKDTILIRNLFLKLI